MPLLLLLAFLVVPLVELYVILQVGQLIGVLPTVALLLAMSVLGTWLVRREGGRTWRAFRDALGRGRPPAREVADGALVILGGALLLTPGFVTDVVGLLCILPPTRALLRRALTRVVARRLVAGAVGRGGSVGPSGTRGRSPRARGGSRGGSGMGGTGAGATGAGGSGRVIEGEIVGGSGPYDGKPPTP